MRVKKLNKTFAFIFAVACVMFFPKPSVAEELTSSNMEAHFFVRYDNTNQKEDGDSHYSPTKYFPIGEVAKDYEYGSSHSDYTSVDGQVDANSAYVADAEGVVTQANVNLYDTFNVTKDTIKEYFSPIYSHIIQEPSSDVISSSILTALGEKWQAAYDSGRVDVVWYVIKPYNDGALINVDGCLYWTKTGDVVDKDEDPDSKTDDDSEPVPTPDPVPNAKPVTPEPDTDGDVDNNSEIANNKHEDDESPHDKSTESLPQTGDEELAHNKLLLFLAFLAFVGSAVVFVLILKE